MNTKRIAFALALGSSVSACGLVTGLSKDYTFDEAADGATEASADDAPSTSDVATGRDATLAVDAKVDAKLDAAPACVNAPAKPNRVKESCYECVLTSCCAQIRACSAGDAGTSCTAYLQCVDDCPQNVGAEACELQCANLNAMGVVPRALATCVNDACAPSACHK